MRATNYQRDDIENPSAEHLTPAPFISEQNLKLFLLLHVLLQKQPYLEIFRQRAQLKMQHILANIEEVSVSAALQAALP